MTSREQSLQTKIFFLKELIDLKNEEIENLKKENTELRKLKHDCETSLCRAEYQWMHEKFEKAKELLGFWVSNCHDGFKNAIGYEERHKTLMETEELLREMTE